jgi:hypothetical protein
MVFSKIKFLNVIKNKYFSNLATKKQTTYFFLQILQVISLIRN